MSTAFEDNPLWVSTDSNCTALTTPHDVLYRSNDYDFASDTAITPCRAPSRCAEMRGAAWDGAALTIYQPYFDPYFPAYAGFDWRHRLPVKPPPAIAAHTLKLLDAASRPSAAASLPASARQATGAVAEAAARYLMSLTEGKPRECHECTGCAAKDVMLLRHPPNVTLTEYIATFCANTLMQETALITAVAYVRRLMTSPVEHRHDGVVCECALQPVDVNPCNLHRLFAACAVIACKFVYDRVYEFKFYAAQLRVARDDLVTLEESMCRLLNFNLAVHGEEFNAANEAIDAMRGVV